MALNGDDDYEWEPPTESEMKVIQAQRERQDRISKLMGGYLLKGYKMLGDCCEQCGTILLQDKQHKNYCVSCQELDSDVDKDNPALNAQAALSQVRERQLASQPSAPPQPPSDAQNRGPSSSSNNNTPLASGSVPLPRPEHCEGAAAGLRASLPPGPTPAPALPALPGPVLAPILHSSTSISSSISSSPAFLPPALPPSASAHSPVLLEAEEALLAKLQWASSQLQTATSLEASIQLCSLITSCAKSLRSLRELNQ